MNTKLSFTRRTFLRGLGTVVALPTLESLRPIQALAGTVAAAKSPVRMAFLFVPNGVNMEEWTPKADGADFDLPYVLEPLQAHKDELMVLTGLTQDHGRANGDGAGDHARSAASWLTGAQPLKSEGSQIRAGISADQVAAEVIGRETRFPSLELGMEPGRQGGKCDSGYSCAYSNNISWRGESTPGTREINPREVFERFFSNGSTKEAGESQKRRQLYRKSILDFVMADARDLSGKVNGNDKQKIDEYLTAVREIEQRVERAEQQVASAKSGVLSDYEVPEGIPESYEEHARLMIDMMVLAFQTDTTRIATFMLANEGSNRPYRNLSISRGHHELSHHQGNPDNLRQIRDINRFHIEQYAYLLNRMRSIPDGDGTLLDNSMVLFGAGIGDGNRHNHDNLPLVLAGRGGGTLTPGRHVSYPDETPMCNLLLSMLERAGAPTARLGDSTGVLRGLDV
ncbi:MAG: DUF1552 domain-containing protein [Chthoniobacteraceae bacterium]